MNLKNLKFFLQGLKFAVVGGLNTAIDFLFVNLLYWLFRPEGQSGLLLISVFAACMAMINSYFMNKRWSFSSGGGPAKTSASEISGFLTVSMLGLLVNTSIFLFTSRYLSELAGIGGFININASRLTGVACAMAVTFLGYKLGVFDTQSVRKFREAVGQSWLEGFRISWRFLICMILAAAIVRIIFFIMVPVAYGDAVNYYWTAAGIASGNFAEVDWFWHSLFTFFEAMLMCAGLKGVNVMMLSSLIPGVLLVLPVYLASGKAFGKATAVLASIFTVLSPRLIEYSVNGYSESLYLFLILCAICVAVFWISEGVCGYAGAAILGFSIAAFSLVRNEAFIFALALIAVILTQNLRRKAACVALTVTVSALAILLYISANDRIAGQACIFQKFTNVEKVYLEQIDWRNAAKETYGTVKPGVSKSSENTVLRLFRHFRENLFYMAERMPGVFFSPVLLFIPFTGLFGSSLLGRKRSGAVFLLAGLIPLLVYPFLQVEPRMLLLSLVAFSITGLAGAWLFSEYIAANMRRPFIKYAFVSVLLLALLPFIPVLAWRSGELRAYHREIGKWISENVPPESAICGDGYGYVLSSCFWADRRAGPRLWTDKPSEIPADMRVKSKNILIIYEEFVKLANPEIITVFDSGIAGMTLLKEFKTKRGRIQVYELGG
jgi:putative flippase GtrA